MFNLEISLRTLGINVLTDIFGKDIIHWAKYSSPVIKMNLNLLIDETTGEPTTVQLVNICE